jgi:NitT/TauT family transport system substrate-binding protein
MFANRRDFLFAAASSATVGLVWSGQRRAARAQEAPPETTRIRLAKTPSLCIMPQYVVDELLAAEGITQVDYIVTDTGPLLSQAIASGQIDFTMQFSGPLVLELDRGRKLTMLAGSWSSASARGRRTRQRPSGRKHAHERQPENGDPAPTMTDPPGWGGVTSW